MLLARRQLLAYGLPGLPLALLGLPLYVYLPSFYVQELGLSLALVGTLLLLARGVDVITDPLIGALNDRWPDGRWRRRAAMLIGAPLLLVGTEFLFRPLAGAGGAYLLGWTLLAYLGWTLISVAYNAWGAELSPHYHERTRIAASREGFMIAGTVLAVSLPVLTGSADDTGAALSQFATLLWVLVPLTLLVAVTSLGEDATAPPAVPRRAPSTDALTRARWAALLQLPGLRRLLLAYLLNGIANGLPATLFLLFVAYVLQAEAQTGPLLATYFLSGILA